jgi:hypothetical protein
MRGAIGLVIAIGIVSTGALASESGQPMSCEDAVFSIAGLAAEPFLPSVSVSPELCSPATAENLLQCGFSIPTSRQDAEGNVYALIPNVDRWEVWRTRTDGVLELVLYLPTHRPAPGGQYDISYVLAIYLEPVRGALYIRLASGQGGPGPWAYGDSVQVCRIVGLVPLADIIRRDLGLPPGVSKGTR